MDINLINNTLDKFMRKIHGVDVYLTPSKYSKGEYMINVLFFPSKFLEKSPEYSEKYYNFFNRSESEILDDVVTGLKYLGVNSTNIKIDDIRFHISSEIPKYLENYTTELISNINEFINTNFYDDVKMSEYVSNVLLDRMEILIPANVSNYPSYISLRLNSDSRKEFSIDPLLNDESFREPLIEFLGNRMKLDPQIDFWFE